MKSKLPIGIAIFVGLPLLAWGVTDIPGYFNHPARAAYLFVLTLVQLAAFVRFPEAMQDGATGAKVIQRQRWVVRLLQIFSLLIVVAAPYCDRRGYGVIEAGDSLRYAGLALAVPGFVLMLWARVALGRQFSYQVTIQTGHRLVTEGLYRWLRHPRYAGILLFFGGTALVHRSWGALLVAAATAATLLWRIRDEEQLMQREFGPAWAAYCRRSWRLVPLVF